MLPAVAILLSGSYFTPLAPTGTILAMSLGTSTADAIELSEEEESNQENMEKMEEKSEICELTTLN